MNMPDIAGIGAFVANTSEDQQVWARLAGFVTQTPLAFTRDLSGGGHVTGSAFVLSPDGGSVLLTHHAKLDRWLQVGGHCDGISDVAFVALKEAYEESGLSRIQYLSRHMFDVDIHEIPARADEPAHLHYDVRYLLQAEAGELCVSQESKALAWVQLKTLEDVTTEPSILRMRDRVLSVPLRRHQRDIVSGFHTHLQ